MTSQGPNDTYTKLRLALLKADLARPAWIAKRIETLQREIAALK